MKPKSINKIKGVLHRGIDNEFYFRIYTKDHKDGFIDCRIDHHDLSIIIDDTDAFLYPLSNNDDYEYALDHSPDTLGYYDGL